MAITAQQLSKSAARGKDIDAIVHEQLQIIDDRLARHVRVWGRNVVAVEIPSNFNVPGLARKDSQRIVYSSILRSLRQRGFEARIQLDDARTILYIAWTTDLDADEIAAMNKLIKDCRIFPADLDEFRQAPARARPPQTPAPARPAGDAAASGTTVGAPTAAEKELLEAANA